MRVFVVGAGPGGVSAALELSRGGADVWLAEKEAWPRPKTCGDGISPHALAELSELGVSARGEVKLSSAFISTPGGHAFRGSWPAKKPWGTILERRDFDAALVAAAVSSGTRFLPSSRVERIQPCPDGVEILVRAGGSQTQHFTADAAIVAEGATGRLAQHLGFPAYRSRLVALRGYVVSERPLAPEYGIFYERAISPGYGWIFPLDDRHANVGIIVDDCRLRRLGGNLRMLLDRWLESNELPRNILGDRVRIDGVEGGIIPSGRSRRSMSRVFLVGDAAGVADPFTAEGISQAIVSGRLAARSLLESRHVEEARSRFERDISIFDRNERAARALRVTFNTAIGLFAKHAASKRSFADTLSTLAFFSKTGFVDFVGSLLRAW